MSGSVTRTPRPPVAGARAPRAPGRRRRGRARAWRGPRTPRSRATACRGPRRAQRLGAERAALVLHPAPGEQPRQPGEPEHQHRALVALPGQADRLAVGDLGEVPAVGGGVVERDQVEHERQRPDRRAGAGALQRVGEQPTPGGGVAQDDRRHGEPGEQVDVVAQLAGLLGERDRVRHRSLSGGRVAAHHPGQPDRRGGEEPGAQGGWVGQLVPGALGDPEHLRRLTGVEAGGGRLGAERHRTLGVRRLRDRGEDVVAAHHRSAPDRDAAGELLEVEQRALVLGRAPGLVEQRERAVGEARVPVRRRGQAEQAPAIGRVGGKPRGALERDGGRRVGAAAAGAGSRLLERRGGRVVDARRGGRQMPGAAIDVAVGQRRGQRAVDLAPVPCVRRRVDGRAGERVAELDRARGQRDDARLLGGDQRRGLDREPGGGSLQQPEVAAVAGRREQQHATLGGGQRAGPPRERAGDPGRDEHRRARGRERERLRLAGELQQRERIAPGRPVQPARGLGREPGQQRPRVRRAQPAEHQRLKVGAVKQRRLALPHPDQHRDRIGDQPPDREQQCLGARPVEPVRVIDEHGTGPPRRARRAG